tara:strand:+ start:41209 stop:42066 length:858 start_codon:yes stop_codon:yes gene_type:complete
VDTVTSIEHFEVAAPNGERFAAVQWGNSGPPILLHHATGFCAATWGEIAEPLAERHTVYSYDARGHGDTSAATDKLSWRQFAKDHGFLAGAILERHGAKAFACGIGHSLGGIATLTAAVDAPHLLDRLLLIEPVLIPENGPGTRRAGRTPFSMAARLRRSMFASRSEARELLGSQEPYSRFTPRTLDSYLEHGLRQVEGGQVELKCSPGLEATIYELGHTDVFERLHDFEVPTQIVVAHDSFFAAAYGRLDERFELVTVPESHVAPMENPQRIATIARSWIAAAN